MSDDVQAALDRAAAAGVEQVVHIGCSLERMQPAVELAQAHPQVFASVGIHPHDARFCDEAALGRVRELAAHPRVVALGETGLDYFYDSSPREQQRTAFAHHAALARELEMPLVLHIRDAHEEAWEVLAESPARADEPGMVHCFTGGPDEARRWLDLGWTLSFSGIATFSKAEPIREAARLCPADRIHVETDAPFLAPVPVRGRKNEPANVAFTCARLAEVRGESAAALASTTSRNTRRLFGIPETGS
jgi:TatD DNase family protein